MITNNVSLNAVEYNKLKAKIKIKLQSLGIEESDSNKVEYIRWDLIGNRTLLVCLRFRFNSNKLVLNDEIKHLLQANMVIASITNINEQDSDITIQVIDNHTDFVKFISNFYQIVNGCIEDLTLNEDSERVNKRLNKLLNAFRISPKMLGCEYLRDCVKICLKSSNSNRILAKDVYAIVAQKYAKSVDNIEKSIRSAIKQAVDYYPEIFRCACRTGQISNLYLIKFLVNNIKTEICYGESIRFYNKFFS